MSLHKQLSKHPLIITLLRILEHSPLHFRHVPAFQWYHHPTCISHKHLGTNKHDLLQTATWINNRVHTDFWIQNSRLFPKHEHIFPDSRLSNRWSKETCKNAGTINAFSWCSANIWVKLNKIWPKWKKFTFKALVVALKKKLKTFYLFFQTLSPFSRLFPGLENYWGNFKSFSQEFKILYEPCLNYTSTIGPISPTLL